MPVDCPRRMVTGRVRRFSSTGSPWMSWRTRRTDASASAWKGWQTVVREGVMNWVALVPS